jgi:flagella basal body P-ring formation protein FlgA
MLAALAAALLFAGGGAAETAQIELRETALVGGGAILLGDVAELSDGVQQEVADLRIGNAPWAGHSRKVSRALVKVRLLSAGHDVGLFRFTGAEACRVERSSVRLEPERIISAARDLLMEQFPDGGPEVQMELLRKVGPVVLPAAEGELQLRARLAGTGPPLGAVRVDVDVVRHGRRLKRIPLSFAVRATDKVAVARRNIAAGEALSEDNVAFAERETSSVHGTCIRSARELKGKVAARPLRAGQPLVRRWMEKAESPVVIQRNQRVFLVLETATLRAVTVGKALQKARQGESARALNPSSGREVVGTAVDDSTIRIRLNETIGDQKDD